jgi:hypothetical protein
MKKILLVFFLIFFITVVQAQVYQGDSVYYQGRYYKIEEYKKIKAEYDRYNFDKRFLPGMGYGYYQPAKADSVGSYSGITVKYLFFRDVSQNDTPGPSHVSVYSKLCLFKNNKQVGQVFIYSAGLDMSFERNPQRFFFIPYFGLEVGGLSQKLYGSTIQFTPTLGLHIISKKNLTLDFCGGYIYPIKIFEHQAGWYADLNLNFVFW